MSYVPIVTPQQTPPSPRVRELAGQLSAVIQDFERTHSNVSKSEIRQATKLASQRRAGRGAEVVTVALAFALLVGMAVLVFMSNAG